MLCVCTYVFQTPEFFWYWLLESLEVRQPRKQAIQLNQIWNLPSQMFLWILQMSRSLGFSNFTICLKKKEIEDWSNKQLMSKVQTQSLHDITLNTDAGLQNTSRFCVYFSKADVGLVFLLSGEITVYSEILVWLLKIPSCFSILWGILTPESKSLDEMKLSRRIIIDQRITPPPHPSYVYNIHFIQYYIFSFLQNQRTVAHGTVKHPEVTLINTSNGFVIFSLSHTVPTKQELVTLTQ